MKLNYLKIILLVYNYNYFLKIAFKIEIFVISSPNIYFSH